MSNPRARTMAHMRQLMAVAAVAGFAATTNRPSSANTPDAGTSPDGGLDAGGGEGGPSTSTGILTGQVVDGQNQSPLADAVVTITSPALVSEQVVLTDQTGMYRVPNLPPGEYSIRVDRDPYASMARDMVTVSAGSTVEVNFKLISDGGYMVVDPVPPPAGCGCRQGY